MTLEELDALQKTAERLRHIRRMLGMAAPGYGRILVHQDTMDGIMPLVADVPDDVVREVLEVEAGRCEAALRAAGIEA